MMKTFSPWTAVAIALLLPSAVFAQTGAASSSDVAYCKALATKYERYLDQDTHKASQSASPESRASLEQCKAGNPTGIAGLEKALKDAGFDLPPRS